MIQQDFGVFVNYIVKAKIIDSNYPIKGCYVWLPYGFEFKENVFSYIASKVKKMGYERYQFPILIPGETIRKVTKEIANFEDGLFWLRKKEGKNLDLFLNPTGECVIYTMFKKWIKHKSDLPLKIFQICSTFRQHKRADVMLNGDELSNLLELHSAFSSKKESDSEFIKLYEVFKEVHKKMGIPFLALRRPVEGNKPVCIDMISFETYLPSKKCSFNVGVLYNQGQIYSKAFKIEFSNQEGGKNNTHQATSGISERGIATMLDLHKDIHGIRLLPEFAPIQIEIIPVYKGKNDKEVRNYAMKIYSSLKNKYRVKIDDSTNKDPRKKFADARQRGIPLRIGVSKRDSDNETLRIYLRTEEKPVLNFPLKKLEQEIPDYFSQIRQKIIEDSKNFFKSKIFTANNLKEVKKIVDEKNMAKIYWCGSLDCFQKLNKKLPGELIGTEINKSEKGICLICGKRTDSPSYYAKRGASP